MHKYIADYLKETNTLIIPKVGALTITNEKTGEMMFMPYLKHDDGKLAEFVALKDGIEFESAKEKVASFAQEITESLDRKGKYKLKGIGIFVQNKDGEVEFEIKVDSEVEEAKKERPAVIPLVETTEPIKDKKQTPAIETPVEEEISKEEAEDISVQEISEDAPEYEAPEAIIYAEKPIIAAETFVEPNEVIREVEKSETNEEENIAEVAGKELNILEKEELAKNQAKLDELKKESKNAKASIEKENYQREIAKGKSKKEEGKEVSKKKNSKMLLLIIMVVVFGAGSVLVGLNFNKIKQSIPFLADKEVTEKVKVPEVKKEENVETQEDVTEATETEGITEENTEERATETVETPLQEEKVEPETKPTPVVTSSPGAYHIIVGTFTEEKNAINFATKLQGEGHSAQVVLGLGRHLVSVKSFDNKENAKSAVSEYHGVTKHAWVFKN